MNSFSQITQSVWRRGAGVTAERRDRRGAAFLSTFFADAGNHQRLRELNVAKIFGKRMLDIRGCLSELEPMLAK